jgi:DNA-binding CsgD family transcriptional regulator/tetratricopeptide (TPR) repeat protein
MEQSITPVRGRDRELAVLDDVFTAARRGRGRIAVIEGPPGIGKSRLVDEACERADASGLSVATATALELGELAPLGCFLDLLSSTTPAIIGHDELGAFGGVTDPRLALLGCLRDAIETSARRTPIVFAIDDLQWADELSVLALAHLARQLASYPVTWIVARRARPTTPVLERCVTSLVDDGAIVLALEPLDDRATETLVSDLGGPDLAATTHQLIALAGGNPFYISEMVRAVRLDDVDVEGAGSATGVPTLVEQSVARRFRAISPEVRELVDVASVFGRRFAVADVAALLGQPASQIASPLSEALDEGIFVEEDGEVAFRHDLVRLVVYDTLPASLRQALHRDAARAIIAAGRSAVDAAPHLSLGARPGDVEAIDLLSAAAAEIGGRTPLAAIDLHRRLLDLTPADDARRSGFVVTLVLLLSASGMVDDALVLADAILETGLDPLMETIVLVASASAAELAMRHDAARHYVERALASPQVPELDLQCRLLAAAIATFSGAIDEGWRECSDVAADAAAAGFVGVEKDALAMQSHLAAQRGDVAASLACAVKSIDLAAELDDPNPRSDPELPRLVAFYCLDRLDEGHELAARGQRNAESHGASWSLFYEQYAVHLAIAEGRLDDADSLSRSATGLMDEFGMTERRPDFVHLRAQLALRRGDLAACRALVKELDELVDLGAAMQALGMNTMSGRFASAEGDPESALAALAHAYDRPSDLLMHQFCDAPLAAELVRIAIQGGSRARSRAAVVGARDFARMNPTVASIRGAACHAEGLFDVDGDALAEAVEWYRKARRPLWLAAGLEDLAGVRSAAAERTVAIPLLEEAMELYFACGATRDVSRTRAILRAAGVQRRLRTPLAAPATGWDALSPAERDVTRLVLEGLTNRGIAERLFISPHTVATHLKHIFLKLDVHSRMELARLVP